MKMLRIDLEFILSFGFAFVVMENGFDIIVPFAVLMVQWEEG